MKAGTEVTIKIGETEINKMENGIEVSKTEYWLNNGEQREATICPAGYATDRNIMELISRDIAKTFGDE
jgi:hypothetical protein